MKNKLLLAFALLCGTGFAQNWATVSASNITDLNQQKLAAGRLCFLGTDQNNVPINFQVGGGGQVLARPFCSNVSNGVVTSFTVPNPANTVPAGIPYRITAVDSSTGQQVLLYKTVAFLGTTFNFDNYAPPGFLGGVGGVAGPLQVNGNMLVTGVLQIGAGDLGLSRDSAGVLDCGNGTLTDKSCWIQAGRFIALNGDFTAAPLGTATSGTNFGTSSLIFAASSWNGSAAQNDNWTLTGGENSGTNPTPFLFLGGPSRTQTWQLVLSASTSVIATSGLNINGPDVLLRGNYWTGSVGSVDDWHISSALGSGANPTSTLAFSHAGTFGAAVVQMPTLKLSNGGHTASMTADVDTSGHDSASFGTGKVMIDGTNGDITVKNPLNGFTVFNGANPIFQIDSNGIIRTVEGQNTTGFGVPLSINTGSANSISGSSVFTQSMSAFPHVGDYRVTITPRMVTLGTGGTLTFSLSYTSDLGAVSCNFNGASMTMSTNTPVNNAVCYIHASSITAPVLTITPSGATGTPFWSAGWYFEELNNF